MKLFYLIATFVLMIASIGGGIFLVKNNQDNRNKAQSCWAECTCSCGNFCADPAGAGCNVQCNSFCPSSGNGNTGENEGSTGTGTVECRKDDPSICPDLHYDNPAYNEMVGRYKGQTECTAFDACARNVTPSGTCDGLSRLSNGESYRGAFVGCNDQGQNCFCPLDFTGNIQCYDDVNNDSCGARTIAGVTETPQVTSPPSTNTPVPTNSPTPTPTPTTKPSNTPTPTPTLKPSPTATGTVKPSNTPTITPSPIPTNTPVITSTPGPTSTNTPTLTLTLTPTNTPINTPTLTSTPTKIIATTIIPSPTRIILPQSGIEFPVQILTILGTIVTLAGFLILL